MEILPVFCDIDDFCRQFLPAWQGRALAAPGLHRRRQTRLCLSEIMTIIVAFHLSGYRHFKAYYCEQVLKHQARDFPHLVSYHRFVELMPGALVPLCAYLQTRRGRCTGLSFIDSTKLAVCHNRRIHSHRVLTGLAARGKTSVDWFYGFKLHLVVNDCGELLGMRLTPGNVDDRAPVPRLVREVWGKLFGDKGYISRELFAQLWAQDLQLVTKIKKRMKNKLLPLWDKILLRKRAIIETITDQLKNISQIEHTRHRSPWNFFVNLIAGIVAYTFRAKKPSLNIRFEGASEALVF